MSSKPENIIATVSLPYKLDHSIIDDTNWYGLEDIDFLRFDFSSTQVITVPGAMFLICITHVIKKNRSSRQFGVELAGLNNNQVLFLKNLGFFSEMRRRCNLTRINGKDFFEDLMIGVNDKKIDLVMPISEIIEGDKEGFELVVKTFRNEFTYYYKQLREISNSPFANSNDEDFDDFTIAVFEIMKNIFDHSESWGIGTIYHNSQGTLICYFDLGIGILGSLKKYSSKTFLNDEEAIDWALQDGNSSKEGNNNNRGRGFKNIRKFVDAKHGLLSIRTGVHHIVSGRPIKSNLNYFPGTQIVIHIPNN